MITTKPEPQPLPARRSCGPVRGFALVATLTMMVLLVLLAVGLLSLSAVTLRSSSQGSSQAEARANARIALMLAIAQLQSELGPDSRISAPHDAGSPSGGQPHWTAVYDAWTADPAGTQADTPGSRKVNFRKWLVSSEAGAGVADEIELVGAGTLGAGAAAGDMIRVPSQTVESGTGNGRIAWWTSDEGMKAKINAGPDDSPSVKDVSNPLFHAQSPPHPDHRVFASLGNFEWKDGQREMALSQGQVNHEELALFHNIHRQIDWFGGVPTLVTKDSADGLAMDRFYMYGKPALEAVQFILCLQAAQTGGTAADGFDLEPGEAAAFGSTKASGYDLMNALLPEKPPLHPTLVCLSQT